VAIVPVATVLERNAADPNAHGRTGASRKAGLGVHGPTGRRQVARSPAGGDRTAHSQTEGRDRQEVTTVIVGRDAAVHLQGTVRSETGRRAANGHLGPQWKIRSRTGPEKTDDRHLAQKGALSDGPKEGRTDAPILDVLDVPQVTVVGSSRQNVEVEQPMFGLI